MNHRSAIRVAKTLLVVCAIFFASTTTWAQDGKDLLTVKRIYSQPSLGGKLTRGVQWVPDGKMVSFFETRGEGKAAKTELWLMDAAGGQRKLLLSAEKLETGLSAEKKKATQATGLGRRPPAEYQRAPSGEGNLVVGADALRCD